MAAPIDARFKEAQRIAKNPSSTVEERIRNLEFLNRLLDD